MGRKKKPRRKPEDLKHLPLWRFVRRLGVPRRDKFCAAMNISTNVLLHMSTGNILASADRARQMVDLTRELFPTEPDLWLTLSDIRPDYWPPEENGYWPSKDTGQE